MNTSINELIEIDKNLNESIYININTNSFLTGEKLLYTIFCTDKLNNKPSKFSKVAYIKLIDNTKKTVFTHKVFIDNGIGNGEFFIPTTLETGSYKLVGYTNWMLNKEASSYFNIDLYIVNPYKENPSNSTTSIMTSPIEVVSDNNISFDLRSKTYKNREKIELGIKTSSDDFTKGNYTLSVRKADGFISQSKPLFNNLNKDANTGISNIIGQIILPELRGELISGRITSSTAAIKNKKIALSIVGQNSNLKIVRTDDQGRFLFNLERPNSNSNIIIQIIENDKEDYTIEIDKAKDIDFSNLNFPNLQFNSDFKNNITARLISSQIENAYYNVKKDSTLKSTDTIPFYGHTSEEFKFDAFTRFPNIEETITEIIKGVYYRKYNNEYTIHVFDYNENYESSLPALIVVDGLILENLNEFFAYSPKNLYKVNVVRGIYYYGAKSFNGIVSFTTKKGDYDTKLKGNFIIRPELLRPQDKKEYFQPDYANNKNARIPDYRHQLLWIPKVDLKNLDSKISFYASDVPGKYEIILEGFSASGAPVFIKESIEIQEPALN